MITVYSLPSQVQPEVLKDSAAVVIDVLRATTVITCAVHSGIKEFIPVLDITEALRLKSLFPEGSVILGGERSGLPIDGFDFGNSPQDYTPQRVAGKTLIITTTNGTAAIHAAKEARKVILAAFVNADAAVKKLANEDRITIICSGTCGLETEEDMLLAGCIVDRLTSGIYPSQSKYSGLNETAERVRRLWKNSNTNGVTELTALLRRSTGGKNLLRIGLAADIAAAAQIDTMETVAEFRLSR
ncbi:MAG: 2-phosphosulfolactate phosphatase [Planctomycetaceae bacterium]|jgi:2-phosphosulfolactate phosphatase|nr:2-phosphosulfolactate phosphatase [Planctomycetaceae bacterium]